MKLKNILIAVTDIEKSKEFYHHLFGLEVLADGEDHVILSEGLVLQCRKVWEEYLGRTVVSKNHSCELYFEELEIEKFIDKLEKFYPEVRYVDKLTVLDGNQKMARFYDLDGNLIEVRTPWRA